MKEIKENYNKTLTWAHLKKRFSHKALEDSALKIFKSDLTKYDNKHALEAALKLLDNKFSLKSLCKVIERDIETYAPNLALIAEKILRFREVIAPKIIRAAIERDLLEPSAVLRAWDYVPHLIVECVKSKLSRAETEHQRQILNDFFEQLESKRGHFDHPKFVYSIDADDFGVRVFDVLSGREVGINEIKSAELECKKDINKETFAVFWADFESKLVGLAKSWALVDRGDMEQMEGFENDLLNVGKALCMRMMSARINMRVSVRILDECTEIFGYFVAEECYGSVWDVEGTGIGFESIEEDIGFEIGFYDLERALEICGDRLDDMIWMRDETPSQKDWEHFENLAKQLRDLLPNYVTLGFGW